MHSSPQSRLLAAISLAALLSAVSCAPPSPPNTPFEELLEGPQPGTQIEVRFRRDALGAAGTPPMMTTSDLYHGVPVALSGELLAITDDWIALQHAERRHWIPRECVLYFTEAKDQ